MGPFQGMSEQRRAAEAPLSMRISGSFWRSAERRRPCTPLDFIHEALWKKGPERTGPVRRQVRISFSGGTALALEKPHRGGGARRRWNFSR